MAKFILMLLTMLLMSSTPVATVSPVPTEVQSYNVTLKVTEQIGVGVVPQVITSARMKIFKGNELYLEVDSVAAETTVGLPQGAFAVAIYTDTCKTWSPLEVMPQESTQVLQIECDRQ